MKTISLNRRLLAVASIALLALSASVKFAGAAQLADRDFKQFGLLTIQDNGRRKPIDTFAKESLMRLTGREIYLDAQGKEWRPDDFLLSLGFGENRFWATEPLILINYRPLIQELGLDIANKRFSFETLADSQKLKTLITEAQAARQQRLELTRLQQEASRVGERLSLFSKIQRGSALLIVPPPGCSDTKAAWETPTQTHFGRQEVLAPALTELQLLIQAYEAQDPFQLSLHAHQLREALRTLAPAVYPSEKTMNVEYFYNHLGAFSKAAMFYGIAIVLLSIGALSANGFRKFFCGTGILVGLTGFLFHALGIALRCLIAGRPPVTNMYESMIWVSFVVTLFGFVFFFRYRALPYLLAALPVSCVTMLLVLQAPVSIPSSIDPLVPVLRDNFWLMIHVLTITASYGAFALALGFSHILLFRYLIDPIGARKDSQIHFWLYRVLQLGVLLIATGTILGGVWANYSWGRFWGWDPKETWALITLLCYIVAIHGRLAGWWGQFGLAVASIVCFSAVLMAWYGVNFILGKGLHSYGFGIGGGQYVGVVVGIDLAFVAAVCLRKWLASRRLDTRPAI